MEPLQMQVVAVEEKSNFSLSQSVLELQQTSDITIRQQQQFQVWLGGNASRLVTLNVSSLKLWEPDSNPRRLLCVIAPICNTMAGSYRTQSIYSSGGGGSVRRSRPPQSTSMSMYQFSTRPSISTSVYSGAFGGGAGAGYSIASAGLGRSAGGLASSSAMLLGGSALISNEKNTLQHLNDRLATFLSQVRSLEDSNKELERQIREYGTRSFVGFDWSIYDQTLKPIQKEILDAVLQNSQIALEIDNAKLAAEDFKNKYESELALKQSVENDILGLGQLKDTYQSLQACLADEIAQLEDEIAFLKKDHEEQLRNLRQQKTADIDVQVDSVPSVDMAAKLQEMRDSYTKLAEQNKKDLDNWYEEQVQIQVTQTAQANQASDGVKVELAECQNQLQVLETDYSSLLGALKGLENNLMNVESRYDMDLQKEQSRIAQFEGELGRLRNRILAQTEEYKNLLNIKMNLEKEIKQYRDLIAGGGASVGSAGISVSSLGGKGTEGTTTIITTTKMEREKL
ncbi:keratin, type I cytoskeletal 47 kDa-like [Hemiscyllium ocellatum]|uniref:keratin, type I cytoskeletal 47 kDa-like n=1 Tax=Hemiscyllium ocellatum TaxID=170820 RepID=UPI0029676975|nr:keratin, type I cytoskeletal 47 kDa-like [Hemiscyllium ocellatum]